MSSIDVNEILSSKPRDERKRPSASRSGDENDPKSLNGGSAGKRSKPTISAEDFLESAAAALERDADSGEQLDENAIKRMITNFDKRALRNTEMRVKYPDQPDKFMESEIELNVAVQEMHAVATVPNLYHMLTSTDTIKTLLQLLTHENTDISCAVVDLLQELTDVDTLTESEEGANGLIDSLLSGQVLAVLVQNMSRLDESNKDDADGVFNSFAVIENMIDFRPEICQLGVDQGLLTWILKRLRTKMPFDANRLYCSEILAVLLQNNDDCKRVLGEQDGIDILLQQLAVYKRHNPSSVDEIEYMENLFNCLCAALLFVSNRAKFLEGEGLQLMNLMLREKKMSRASALKVVDYATTGPEGKDNCNKFVEILGLRTLFPLYMKTPAKGKRKGHTAEEHEEHVCAILASLLKNCSENQRQRIFSKFVEKDHEKVERLVELHFKYTENVRRFEKELKKRRSTDDMDEDELYLEKLDAGLFTLQLVDYILAEVYLNTESSAVQRLKKILSMKGGSMKDVKNVLLELAENLAQGIDPKQAEGSDGGHRERITNLVQKL